MFPGDLQLYSVALNIIWSYPAQYNGIVLRLGGMHTLMRTLMEIIGLADLLEIIFGGVLKMLTIAMNKQNSKRYTD